MGNKAKKIACIIGVTRATLKRGTPEFNAEIDEIIKRLDKLAKSDESVVDADLLREVQALRHSYVMHRYSEIVREKVFKEKLMNNIQFLDSAKAVDAKSPVPGHFPMMQLRDTVSRGVRLGGEGSLGGVIKPIATPIYEIMEGVRGVVKQEILDIIEIAEKRFNAKGLFANKEFTDDVDLVRRGGVAFRKYKEAATLVGEQMKNMDLRYNVEPRARANIPFLSRKNYASIPYNRALMRNERDAAIEALKKHLDRTVYVDDSDVEGVYEAILHAKDHIDSGSGIRVGTRSRVVKWASPLDEHLFVMKFGERNSQEIFMDDLVDGAARAAVEEIYGPRWNKTLEEIAEEVAKELRSAGKWDRAAAWEYGQFKLALGELTGRTGWAPMTVGENIESAAMHYNVFSKLNFLAKYLVVDIANGSNVLATATGEMRYLPTLKAFTSQIASNLREAFNVSFRDMPENEVQKMLAKELGFVELVRSATLQQELIIDAISSSRGITGRMADVAQKVSSFTMKYTLQQALTKAYLQAFTTIQLRQITRAAKYTWDDLTNNGLAALKLRLQEYGIDNDTWEIFRGLGKRADDIADLSELRNRNNAAHLSITAFLRGEAKFALNMPDAYIASMKRLHGVLGAGNPIRVLWSLSMNFMLYGMQIHRNFTSRIIRERRVLGKDQTNWSLFAMLGGLIATNVFVVQVEKMVRGKPTYDWDSPYLTIEAIERAGIFWIFGTIANQKLHYEAGGRGTELENPFKFGGVFGEDLLRGSNIALEAAYDLFTKQEFDVKDQRALLEFGVKTLPLNNAPFIAAGVDYTLDYMYPKTVKQKKALNRYYKNVGRSK